MADASDAKVNFEVVTPTEPAEVQIISMLKEPMKLQEELQQEQPEVADFLPVNAERRLP